MKIIPLLAAAGGLLLAFASMAAPAPEAVSAPIPSAASPALTRGEVIAIVRREVRRAFALRDWHHYSGYIDEYTGTDTEALFSLSTLDRATAIGNPKSSVRVIVYADYECPYCKRFENGTSAKLHKRFGSDALFLFRFFPLGIHGETARSEAIAGACIARLAGAKAFRRFTHEIYDKTASNGHGTKEALSKLAASVLDASDVDLDRDTLDEYYRHCTQGKTGAALIAPAGAFRGVTGTPTVFVVNVAERKAWRLAGAMPDWVFEALIGNVLGGRPGNSDWAIEHHLVSPPD